MRSDVRRAVSFLTPFGGPTAPSPAALDWFPLVGVAIGAAVGGVWWLSDRAWDPHLSAAVVVAADAACTGFLHLDGLADSADGLLPPLSPERRLDVMADPAVGAFGAITLALVLLLRYGAFIALAPSVPLLAGLWCASRTVMAVAARVVPYARADEGGGLASAFVAGARRPVDRVALVGVVAAGGLAAWAGGWVGVLAVAAGLLAAVGVVELARHRIGGFTGDVLGAAGVVCETVGLLVAAGKW
jgi:adenosylcobinamide-GDP ribazoletransferase